MSSAKRDEAKVKGAGEGKKHKNLPGKNFGGAKSVMTVHQQAKMWGNITREERKAPEPKVRSFGELSPEERERYGL